MRSELNESKLDSAAVLTIRSNDIQQSLITISISQVKGGYSSFVMTPKKAKELIAELQAHLGNEL